MVLRLGCATCCTRPSRARRQASQRPTLATGWAAGNAGPVAKLEALASGLVLRGRVPVLALIDGAFLRRFGWRLATGRRDGGPRAVLAFPACPQASLPGPLPQHIAKAIPQPHQGLGCGAGAGRTWSSLMVASRQGFPWWCPARGSKQRRERRWAEATLRAFPADSMPPRFLCHLFRGLPGAPEMPLAAAWFSRARQARQRCLRRGTALGLSARTCRRRCIRRQQSWLWMTSRTIARRTRSSRPAAVLGWLRPRALRVRGGGRWPHRLRLTLFRARRKRGVGYGEDWLGARAPAKRAGCSSFTQTNGR